MAILNRQATFDALFFLLTNFNSTFMLKTNPFFASRKSQVLSDFLNAAKTYIFISFIVMITTVNLFSNNSKAEDCTSNALKAIQEEQQDVDGCIFYFKYFLNPGNTAVTFRWDFGDGGISFDPNPTYTFSHGYSQTVTLTITDQNGCTSSKTINFGSGDCHGGFCNYAEGGDDCCFEICVDGVEGWTWVMETIWVI